MSFSPSIRFALALLLGLAGAGQASAALLPGFPDAPTNPDMYSKINSISYNAGTDTFSVLGTPQQLILPDSTDHVALPAPVPTFSIVADITSAGAIGGGGGTLSITGKLTPLGNINTNLLSGVLESFGFSQPNSSSGRFEFIFGSLTGELASYYASGKAYALVTADDLNTLFDGTFLNSDGFSFSGPRLNADTFGNPVPEPAGATLLGLALAALLSIGRRKRR